MGLQGGSSCSPQTTLEGLKEDPKNKVKLLRCNFSHNQSLTKIESLVELRVIEAQCKKEKKVSFGQTAVLKIFTALSEVYQSVGITFYCLKKS